MTYDAMRTEYDTGRSNSKNVNRVYTVVEIEMTPYGEDMCDGATEGIFKSLKSAKAYIKELQDCHRFNFADKKDGHLRVRMPKWVVRSMKLED